MQSETFEVRNVKCAGCVKAIVDGIGSLPGVSGVTVSVEDGQVTVTSDGLTRTTIVAKLAELGYPETGG
ncbi:MAG TPA: copper chaperone [Gammaproteobacteria bacterium]|nr:copper chaperone [Gammaproteobacteria bacterium]